MRNAMATAAVVLGVGVGVAFAGPPEAKASERLGGEAIAEVQRDGMLYRCGPCIIDTKLPVGYPAPTAPGAIELKHYPAVRRAQVRVDGGPDDRRSANGGFFPLFRHITSNDIAMTAPVEMDFLMDEQGTSDATMAFLYEKTSDGPTGEGRNGVEVVDAEPMTVISIGVKGRPDRDALREQVGRLEAAASAHAGWESTGACRWLGYNGPNVPVQNQWYEVQVVVRPVATEPAGEGAAAPMVEF